MRTIKFRAKTLRNTRWVFGDLFRSGTDPSDEEYSINYWDPESGWMNEAVRPETISQFTSLRDKNGKEIYEGDILSFYAEKELLEVRFVRGVFAFLWSGDLNDEFPTQSPTHEWAEVVGNIYENRSLLKSL